MRRWLSLSTRSSSCRKATMAGGREVRRQPSTRAFRRPGGSRAAGLGAAAPCCCVPGTNARAVLVDFRRRSVREARLWRPGRTMTRLALKEALCRQWGDGTARHLGESGWIISEMTAWVTSQRPAISSTRTSNTACHHPSRSLPKPPWPSYCCPCPLALPPLPCRCYSKALPAAR